MSVMRATFCKALCDLSLQSFSGRQAAVREPGHWVSSGVRKYVYSVNVIPGGRLFWGIPQAGSLCHGGNGQAGRPVPRRGCGAIRCVIWMPGFLSVFYGRGLRLICWLNCPGWRFRGG